MAIINKPLINTRYAASSLTSEYVALNLRAVIDKFTVTNTSASAETITVNIVPAAAIVGSSNQVVKDRAVAASETVTLFEMINQYLNAGDSVHVGASGANALVIRANGREIT